MADLHPPPVLGQSFFDKGNVTTLKAVGASSARRIESMLGFHSGRLAQGFALLVLKELLQPEDFEFDGITLRSGGRLGLPEETRELDLQRRRVHDEMMQDYGEQEYRRQQRFALGTIATTGPQRIIRIRPVTLHDDDMAPAKQYPMGGGSLQWKLTAKKRFLVAMLVDARQYARTAEPFAVFLGENAQYDDRGRIYRYLERA